MKPILLLIAILFANLSFSQDLIYLKSKKVLTVEIVEIEGELVIYREFKSQEKETYVLPKNDISKIKTKSGKIIQIEPILEKDGQEKHVIKTDIFSFANSMISVAYERSLKPKSTWEIQAGIIGLGSIPEEVIELNGFFMRTGFKIKRSPEYFTNKGLSTNLFRGQYFKPEIVIGRFSETRQVYDWQNNPWYDPYTRTSRTVSFTALVANYGIQWMLGDNFTLDGFIGIGVGSINGNKDPELENLNYPIFTIQNVVLQSGLKLGYIF